MEMMRALCYGGTVVNKRPIFQPVIMWVTVILSAPLCEFELRENRAVVCIVCAFHCVGSFPSLYQMGGSYVLLFYSVWAVAIAAR